MTLKSLFRYFLIWQILIIFIVSWAKNIIPAQNNFIGGQEQGTSENPHPYQNNPELYFRGNFDGIYYVSIARRGLGLYQEAFFPLYPSLIKKINPVINNSVISGVLISSGFFFLGLLYFVKLIRLDYDPLVSLWSVIALLTFPVSFFFTSVYTEGLFFFLAVSSFYFARKGNWWLSAILVSVATYTRFAGVFLIPSLLFELQSQYPKIKLHNLLPFLIMPIGILIYSNYLWKVKGDPLAFIHVQKNFDQGRSDKIVLLYQVVYRYTRMLFSVNVKNPLFYTLALESFVSLSFIAIGIVLIFKKFRPSYIFFTLSSLLIPTMTGTFTSMPRYALICFPVFIYLGKLISENKSFRSIYLALSLSLAVLFLSLFARGFWVA